MYLIPEIKLYHIIKHIKRTMIGFKGKKKVFWSRKYNTNWVEKCLKLLCFSNGRLMHPYDRRERETSLKKMKPSFLAMLLASDPAFPQSPVPMSALTLPLSKSWHCRLPQQVMRSNLFRLASFQQPTEGFLFCLPVSNRDMKHFAPECSLLESPRPQLGDFSSPQNMTAVYITFTSPL